MSARLWILHVPRMYKNSANLGILAVLQLWILGSERESVTYADFMRVLVFGSSGYPPEDEGIRLEQSTGVARV